MKRLMVVLGIVLIASMLGACGGGGNNNTPDNTSGPLTIALLTASPSQGSSPLRVAFVANITGGVAPYYYAWDLTNDGSFDSFQNGEFNRTITISHDYFLLASDAGGATTYQAVLRVTDSVGTKLTSDPVVIVVLGSSSLNLDPIGTFWYTDEQTEDGLGYIARTGKPVFFRAQPTGGREPYQYQWDFNRDGVTDSTVSAPQYTFTNTTENAVFFTPRLTIVDAGGDQVLYDYEVIVYPLSVEPPHPGDFIIVLDTSPPAKNGVVELLFDPSGNNENLPLEPRLDMSVVVDPNPANPGIPPYEYYWDFENDRAFDSQALSPTIPYYDSARKILVNPYYHLGDVDQIKTYTLRVLVIDSSGHREEAFRTIVARNMENTPPNDLNVNLSYYVDGTTPPAAFDRVNGSTDTRNVIFTGTVSGSTGSTGGSYQYYVDTTNQYTIDAVPEADWKTVDAGVITATIPYEGVSYFPTNVKVRALDSTANVADSLIIQTPVSLVQRRSMPVEGTLMNRNDLTMSGSWVTQAGGPNTNYLVSREVIITGGRQGTSPLREVQKIQETFAPPAAAGDRETRTGLLALVRAPMNMERAAHMMYNDGSTYYAIGGENVLNGILSSIEFVPTDDNGGLLGWTVWGEMGPGYYPLSGANGCAVPGLGILYTGGLHAPSAVDIDNVSGNLISFDPNRLIPFIDLDTPMITERYQGAAAYANGKFYVLGGRKASGQSVATVEAYDLSNEQWELAPSMLEPRSNFICETVGGMIYVLGGAYYPDKLGNKTLITTAEVFNPATGVWSYTVPPSIATSDAGSAALPGSGSVNAQGATINTIIYFGGAGTTGETNFLEEFIYLYTVFPAGP